MGYELHLVRNEQWWEPAGGGISLEEWASFVEGDGSMRMDGFAEVIAPDGTRVRIENDGLAVWMAHSGNVVGGNQAWLDFRSGRIVVKSPDRELLTKMFDIAGKLNARIFGDEGEEYHSPDDHGVG